MPEDFDWQRYASAVPVGTPWFDDADGASALQHVLAATARLSAYQMRAACPLTRQVGRKNSLCSSWLKNLDSDPGAALRPREERREEKLYAFKVSTDPSHGAPPI